MKEDFFSINFRRAMENKFPCCSPRFSMDEGAVRFPFLLLQVAFLVYSCRFVLVRFYGMVVHLYDLDQTRHSSGKKFGLISSV